MDHESRCECEKLLTDNVCPCENPEKKLLESPCQCAHCGCKIGKGETAPSEYISVQVSAGEIVSLALEIDGMTCAACVSSIEGLADPNKGITSISVNLILGDAVVTYDPSLIKPEGIIQVIEEAGFEARPKTSQQGATVFDIEGMTCASCSSALESGLLKVKGITAVSVNLIENICSVEHDSNIVGVRDIISAIEDIGYGARIHHGNKDARKERQARVLQKKLFLFLAGLAFSVPALLISMLFPLLPNVAKYFSHEISPGLTVEAVVMLILATPVQFILGSKFYIGAFKSLRHGVANMDVLIVVGTTASYIYSVIAIVLDVILKYKTTSFFEISILLITFVFLGGYLETYAKGKTSQAITKLMSLQASKAIVVEVSENFQIVKETEVDVEVIQVGDILKVPAGAQVPVDGVVVQGNSSVDESMLTGESMPVSRGVGDQVIGATINLQGLLLVRATKVGSNTMLAKIVKLVEEAQTQKAPIQAVADRISRYFVPCVVVIAVLTFVIWFSLAQTNSLPEGYIQEGLNNTIFALLFSVAVLVIACPCALGLATPTAVMVGTGVAAKHGVLIKGGAALEKAYKLSAIIFDKTGTLTQGKPVVTEVHSFDQQLTKERFLQLAVTIEAASSHPLAKAIVEFSKKRDILPSEEVTELTELPGRGLQCKVQGKVLVAGNLLWMNENGCQMTDIDQGFVQSLQEKGVSIVLFGLDKAVIGVVGIADTPRPEASEVVHQLQKTGLEVWMVTGDNRHTAKAVADLLGIKNIFSEVLPHQKSEKVAELQARGLSVAMIGDGINDSPALAKADVGIAIGAGTDVAIETAEIVLMKSNLWDVVTAIDLSKTVFRRIKFNFVWAFGYNVIGIPLAAGVLFPVILKHFPPFVAALAMALSSVSVILSSLLLRLYREPKSRLKAKKIQSQEHEMVPI